MEAFEVGTVAQEVNEGAEFYREMLRVPALSAGVYCLPAAGSDPQSRHHEDEVYCVVSGRARIEVDGEDRAVEPGSVVYVAATVPHRFHTISEDLTVLVIFGPAETRV
jgi:mannose-6-phosphate isomerase-like protein (cupin superfamily)